MGFYNKLHAKVKCSNCNMEYDGIIQFKFGHTRQLDYRVGDKIKWEGVNDLGVAGLSHVKIPGYLETFDPCPHCNQSNLWDEFDIYINHDVITKIEKMENPGDYIENGLYKVL